VYSIKQIIAVLGISLLGIPRRLGACLVIVVGIAGAVTVFICVLAMARGFMATAATNGRADRVIVLSKAATAEAGSVVPRDAVGPLLSAPQIKRDPAGHPIASADYIAFARLSDRQTGLDVFATVRGVGPQILALRPEIHLVAGRMFKPAVHELIVGKTLQRRLAGLNIGSTLALPKGDWTVVGVFESNGDAHESELLADVETLLAAAQRNRFNSFTALLDQSTDFDAFRATLLTNPLLSVAVKREQDYLLEASASTTRLLNLMASVIGGVMAVGAALAAVNAMFSAIASRSTEIATLRAIGYEGVPVIASVFLEAMLFALIGAGIGATIAWSFFNGNIVNALTSDASPAPMGYVLKVDAGLITLGVASACVVGLIGGLFPAIRVARASVVAALRGQ
jgi:putative ABC transport system permease protein